MYFTYRRQSLIQGFFDLSVQQVKIISEEVKATEVTNVLISTNITDIPGGTHLTVYFW